MYFKLIHCKKTTFFIAPQLFGLIQENARLTELNLKLQLEVEQWKSQFKVWFGDAVTQGVAEQRQRIGFK